MFADDTTLYLTNKCIHSLERTLNSELENVASWLRVNKLLLNIQKTSAMLFSNSASNNLLHLHVNNVNVTFVNKLRFLGVYIDNKLMWKYHIESIACKISKVIGMINKIKGNVSRNVMINLYYIFVSPYLNYCNLVWGNAAHVHINKLHILQKRIVRIICKVNFREHTKELFSNINVLNVFDIYKYNVNLFMFKHYKNLLPLAIAEIFTFISSDLRYPSRSQSLYVDFFVEQRLECGPFRIRELYCSIRYSIAL